MKLVQLNSIESRSEQKEKIIKMIIRKKYNSIIFLFIISLLFSWCDVIENSPIVPILTAIATSAVGLFHVQVDTLHIAKYLRDAAQHKRNRAAFVRDLLYTAFYRSGQGYNVIVFNLAEEHRQKLYGVIFYGSVAFSDHSRYGIWIFDHGVFENQGARGWHNWGMIGSFKKSKDGATIYFHKRHRIDHSTTITTTTTTTMPSIINITDWTSNHFQDLLVFDDKQLQVNNIEIKNEETSEESRDEESDNSSSHKINIKIEDRRTKKSNQTKNRKNQSIQSKPKS